MLREDKVSVSIVEMNLRELSQGKANIGSRVTHGSKELT